VKGGASCLLLRKPKYNEECAYPWSEMSGDWNRDDILKIGAAPGICAGGSRLGCRMVLTLLAARGIRSLPVGISPPDPVRLRGIVAGHGEAGGILYSCTAHNERGAR